MAALQVGTEPLAAVDLVIRQGSDTSFALAYTATDEAGAPVATDFTGWVARAQVRDKVGGAIWVSLTTGAGFTHASTATTLTVTGIIGHAVSEASAWNAYKNGVWDVELVRADGWVIPLAAGRVTVTPDVTRDA